MSRKRDDGQVGSCAGQRTVMSASSEGVLDEVAE